MKIKHFVLWAFCSIASFVSISASTFIGISADGSKDEFQIGKVQSIKFDPQHNEDKGYRTIVFSSENSGVANESSSTVAILVYPNPVSDYITVSGIEEDDEVVLRGVEGKIVSRTKGMRVDVKDLPVGNYILSVRNKSVKFIKK